jgi:hypothetical protein
MAKDANKSLGFICLVPLDHVAEVRRDVSNQEIREMLDWANDQQWPGHFRHRYDHDRQAMVFSFTDEDVAFQFKIRWG